MGITNLSLDDWFPEHALVSSTRFIVSLDLIQSVSLDSVHPAFHPMFVRLVLFGIIRDAKDLLHPLEKCGLKRLTLVPDQYRLRHLRHDTIIPPERVKRFKSAHIRMNDVMKSGE